MLEIRVARPADYERIGEIAAQAYAAAGNLDPAGSYLAVLRDAAGRAAAAELLVAVDGAGPVGTVTAVRPGDALAEVSRPGELEFRMLAVAPEAAGRGVGRLLVEAVLERARAEGAERVVLCVNETAGTPRRLYERLGFRRLPERDRDLGGIALLGYGLEVTGPGPGRDEPRRPPADPRGTDRDEPRGDLPAARG